MRLPTSLTSRLVLAAVALVAVVGLLVSLATTVAMRSFLMDRLDEDVQRAAERATNAFDGRGRGGPDDGDGDGPGDDVPCAADVGAPRGQGEGTLTACFDTDGTARGYAVTRDGGSSQLTSAQLATVQSVGTDGDVGTVSVPGLGRYRLVGQELSGVGGVVTGLPTAETDDITQSLVVWELLLSLLGVAAAYGVGQWLVRRTLRPLHEVAAVAHEVTELPLDHGSVGQTVRVPERLTDESTEVGQVGASLNSLLGHVEQALDARHRSEQHVRQFVADASHELRTPLTTIRGYAELAGRSPEVLPTSMAKVSEEAQRMSSLVDDLLLLARLDSGRPLASEPVDLTALLVSAVDDARVVDPQRQWALRLPAEPIVVPGDALRLHQVVTNLLGNARRHTPPGTVVTSALRVDAWSVVLTVHDTGPGVPPGLDVFERFTRGDGSRTRASGGVGLGLSLVAAIVAAHGGTVGVHSRPGDTTFEVVLPLGAESALAA